MADCTGAMANGTCTTQGAVCAIKDANGMNHFCFCGSRNGGEATWACF